MLNEETEFDPLETLTVKEAAALLHVSRPTLVKYIKAGQLPSLTLGRCRRIRRTDLERFLGLRTRYGWQRHRPEAERFRQGFADADYGEEIPF